MKKKIVIVGAIIIVIAALFAMCGGDGNSNDSVSSLKPDGVELKGDLKGCFEVVDKEYKLLEDGLYPVICVELKRTSTALPFNPNAGSFSYSTFTGDNGEEIEIELGYELLDENNNVVHTTQPGEYSSYDVESNDIEPLMKLNPGETGTLIPSITEYPENSFFISSVISEKSPHGAGLSRQSGAVFISVLQSGVIIYFSAPLKDLLNITFILSISAIRFSLVREHQSFVPYASVLISACSPPHASSSPALKHSPPTPLFTTETSSSFPSLAAYVIDGCSVP